MAQTATPPVAPACAGPISDQLLEQAIRAARAAQAGNIDQLDRDTATLFLLTAAPVMEECLDWRRRMGVIRSVATADNIVVLPGC